MSTKKPLRVLITNDDGYYARGLQILQDLVQELTDDVWVVAPAEQQSGKGHSLTYRDPLRLNQHGDKKYSVDGTPTDCIIIALQKVLKDNPPDVVISGINNGENLAESITQSGTIGAAIESVIHGIPAIALSQVSREAYPTDWSVSKSHGVQVLRDLLKHSWNPNTLLNVNFPHTHPNDVAGIHVCRHGRRTQMGGMVEAIDPRGRPYYWVGVLHNEINPPQDTDLWGALHNYITVTPINLDLTHYAGLENLRNRLSNDFESPIKKAG